MITLNLKAITEKTGKNLSEIARDLEVNRNTIQSFASGRVGGIRFSTLEKMVKTFDLPINELLIFQPDKNFEPNILPNRIYHQEAEAVPFTVIYPFHLATRNPSPNLNQSSLFGVVHLVGRGQYFEAFLDQEVMANSAAGMLRNFNHPSEFSRVWQEFLAAGERLSDIYNQLFDIDPASISSRQLINWHQEIFKAYENFWRISIFIDTFDTGVDQEEINRLAKKYNLSTEDVAGLTTPTEKIFAQEKIFEFFRLVEKYADKKNDKNTLADLLEKDRFFQAYRKKFDAASSNYAVINHITATETAGAIIKILASTDDWREQFFALNFYEKNRRAAIKKILEQRQLSTNPLWLFERLTFFRETRKKYNLMGIHALEVLLLAIERLTGIPKKYLQHLLPDEVELVLRGRISLEELKRRREEGVMYVLTPDGNIYSIYGKQAESIKKDLESRMGVNEAVSSVAGQTACQGYAKGVARIILDVSQFDRFHEGEILVTGMTRPEFVPLMKKAAAIVTNEGGITCHAAIVSRELGVPCIIGTRVATKVIPDGATIEVRANHGTVRIIKEDDKKS